MVHEMLTHPLVDPFITATQQTEAITRSEGVRHVLVELLTTGAQQDEWTWWLRCFNGSKDWLRPHQHAGATTEGSVIHAAVHVSGIVANVVIAQIDSAR
jgi:hypothetical protein